MAVTRDGASSDRSLRNYLAVLRDTDRRTVVSVLAEEDTPVSLSLLADAVAAETRGVSSDASHSGRERLKTELHHAHLPKLDEAGVLEYSPEDHLVAPTDETSSARRVAATLTDI